jgi:hypothetical protein
MMEKVPMTAGGYAALEVELKQRQSVERPRIIEHIAEARSHGDLSENAEYHAAKEEQSHNEGRIAELEDKLARADIIHHLAVGAGIDRQEEGRVRGSRRSRRRQGLRDHQGRVALANTCWIIAKQKGRDSLPAPLLLHENLKRTTWYCLTGRCTDANGRGSRCADNVVSWLAPPFIVGDIL